VGGQPDAALYVTRDNSKWHAPQVCRGRTYADVEVDRGGTPVSSRSGTVPRVSAEARVRAPRDDGVALALAKPGAGET